MIISLSSLASIKVKELSSSALEMLVPGHAVGNVMGRGRANVDNIRKISEASVEISDNKSSCGDRYDQDYFPGKRKRGKDYKEGMLRGTEVTLKDSSERLFSLRKFRIPFKGASKNAKLGGSKSLFVMDQFRCQSITGVKLVIEMSPGNKAASLLSAAGSLFNMYWIREIIAANYFFIMVNYKSSTETSLIGLQADNAFPSYFHKFHVCQRLLTTWDFAYIPTDGPAQYCSDTVPIEKFFPLTRAKQNNPEGCIAEETISEEIIEFFSEYHKSKETIGIPPDKHETYENEEGKPLSALQIEIEIIDISSDSSDDRRWAAKKASALVFYGPSTQGLLDAYGYGTIEEYLEWNYFPSTDNESTNMETTDKGNTDKDCIDDSNSAMSKGKYVPVCKKNNPNVYSHVPVTGCVLGLASVTTWDEIEKKIGARKTKTCADKAKGKRKVNLMIDKLNISAASLKFLLLLEVLKNYSK
ncbi:reverse transcriptase domain-containing protein [Tanacetum coccineum]